MNNMTRPALSGYKSNHSYSPCDARRFLLLEDVRRSEVAGAILLPAWVARILIPAVCCSVAYGHAHHLGLKLLRREGFLLGSYVQTHSAKFSLQFVIALSRCKCSLGAFARLLIVIVVVTFVEKHKSDVVLGVEKPITQPRP